MQNRKSQLGGGVVLCLAVHSVPEHGMLVGPCLNKLGSVAQAYVSEGIECREVMMPVKTTGVSIKS